MAASVVLFGSYLLIRALPQLTLQRIFNAYFFCLGTFAVSGGVRAPLKGLVSLLPARCWSWRGATRTYSQIAA